MRGKEYNDLDAYGRQGITPAHAGKSFREGVGKRSALDHPRPCGEKTFSHKSKRVFAGSPPPMRGKAANADGKTVCGGITPAHAGKREAN